MADEYQRGSDAQWVEHSNEELKREVKWLRRRLGLMKLLSFVLFLVTAFIAFRYHQAAGIRSLWPF